MPQIPNWPETPLSEILKLRGRDTPAAACALARILETYREPIRAFVARRIPRDLAGHVDDWTHGFIVKFIEQSLTTNWDPEVGHLRHYVARALHNFMRDQMRALARRPEYSVEPKNLDEIFHSSPEFHREWAEEAVSRALSRLEALAAGNNEHEQRIRVLRLRYGIGLDGPQSYEQIAASLGKPLVRHQIDNVLRRARLEFVEVLRDEVRALVSSELGIDSELWALSDRLSGAFDL